MVLPLRLKSVLYHIFESQGQTLIPAAQVSGRDVSTFWFQQDAVYCEQLNHCDSHRILVLPGTCCRAFCDAYHTPYCHTVSIRVGIPGTNKCTEQVPNFWFMVTNFVVTSSSKQGSQNKEYKHAGKHNRRKNTGNLRYLDQSCTSQDAQTQIPFWLRAYSATKADKGL